MMHTLHVLYMRIIYVYVLFYILCSSVSAFNANLLTLTSVFLLLLISGKYLCSNSTYVHMYINWSSIDTVLTDCTNASNLYTVHFV